MWFVRGSTASYYLRIRQGKLTEALQAHFVVPRRNLDSIDE